MSPRIAVSNTSPLSTAMPESAMNPMAADTENGIPLSQSIATPPVSASGTALNTSNASRAVPSAASSKRKISAHHEQEALAPRREVLKLAAPGEPIAGRQRHLGRDSLAHIGDDR